jgi:hypothetical protein
MKNGFAHFDSSHRENFCAAVLLLAMEVDDAVKECIANLVRGRLGIDASSPLLGFGREVRLSATEDNEYARVDLCLRFGSPTGLCYAFVEVKTHERWHAAHVADQVRDQAERKVARGGERRVLGCVLLAPDRLCQRVRDADHLVQSITWPCLLEKLRALRSPSPLTALSIQHLENNMDRSAGLDREITLNQFEQAVTTLACLRQLLVDCITDVGGKVHGEPLYLTPGDGKPRRVGDWAWHGLAVPFSLGGRRGRVGIYKYAEAPPGEENALDTLWLETYLGDGDVPVAFVKFTPPTLATKGLDAVRAALTEEWKRRAAASADMQATQ